MTVLRFPDGFLWGASTSSYQVEGGIDNADWSVAGREGKVPEALSACGHYERYEEDLDLAKELGGSTHRFSLEWSRIEPREGEFDEAALAHYRAVAAACTARGMLPMVTLWHFTEPAWFSARGGFLAADAPEIFARYARRAAQALSEVSVFTTMNEPEIRAGNGYLSGAWPPFRKDVLAYRRSMRNLSRAHRRAYRAVKAERPDATVGVVKNNIHFEGRGLFGALVASLARAYWNRSFLDSLKGQYDFIGLNHYNRMVFWRSQREEAAVLRSDFGWELHPPSILPCLRELRRYRVPLYVTENGVADAEDSRRWPFIKGTLEAVHRACAEGIPVKGYCHWSLLDNFEWAEGFTKRFGLVAVAYDDGMKRTVRESARRYAEVCRTNELIV